MGSSKFISIEEAASRLGKSSRTVYRYATRGLFKTKPDGRHLRVCEDDLNTFQAGQRDALASPVERDVIMKLQADVQTLKMHLATVMRILNVRYEALALTAPEYDLLHQTASQLSTEGWSPMHEETWSEYLLRMKLEDLEGLERATKDPHPWRPFLRLATTMHLRPFNEELRDMFAAGRSNIHHLAGVWCVLKGDSPRTFDLLEKRDAAPLKKLLRRLQKD